jgi:hypothetical protein
MTLTALLYVTLFANLLNATLAALNLKMLFVMSNVKSPNVKLSVPIKDVKCLTALNVLPSANNPTALLTVKHPSPNASLSVRSLSVIGNATSPTVLNLSVSLYAKTPTVFLRLNVALVLWEHPELLNLSHSLKKLKETKIAVNASSKIKMKPLTQMI